MKTASKSVKTIIERIDSKEILLPSMQRKFVWPEDKIINLYDSIMKGYPFGNFIFWELKGKEAINKYHFYQFIKDYSPRDGTINPQAGKIIKDSIEVVLDGQQRLTSLYIGIKGSLTTIDKWKQAKKAENWKKKHLYIIPHVSSDERNENETPYRFFFLEDSIAASQNKLRKPDEQYYLVSDLYGITKKELYGKFGVKRLRQNHENWMCILETLRFYINDAEIMNYSVIDNSNIADVLEIFKRINNGGTPLSPSNLLFSTVITSWEKGREEMDEFILSINKEDVIFIKEDFLIRACVYLMNKPASAKIEILTKDVVSSIAENWEMIKKSITNTKNFLKKNNISHAAILSYNVLLPIVYFYYYLDNEVSKKDLGESETQLLYFFAVSQLFSLFGGSSASTLDSVRKNICINNELGKLIVPFKINNLFSIDLSAGRIHAFKISKEQVEKLIDDVRYGDRKSFSMLCLLQPQIKINGNNYDVDHVCSQDELKQIFRKKRKEDRQILENKKNLISNLQLLEYNQNRGDKNSDTLFTWVVEKKHMVPFDPYREEKDKNIYKIETIDDFLSYYGKRRELIINYLCECFDII